ncbi:peptidoglycan DD-metalloendopeptidase family protein [Streptomyces sp. NPDC001822]|uniref:peptidoglycan DD-metalloendopeptidase family protein n=1 Tax=Streptomyces sp. NPDC001822 TaxID=3364614 RepID=UPI003698D88D
MNDQHPHAGYVDYDTPTGSFDTDPLFGNLPGPHDAGHETYGGGFPAYDGGYGSTDSGAWDTGAHQQAAYDAYGVQGHPQAPQGYDTTAAWPSEAAAPAQYGSADTTGQWDTAGWDHTGAAGQWAAGDTGAFATTTFESTAYTTGTYSAPAFETAGYESYATPETGTYDATAWNTGATPETAAYASEQTSYPLYEQQTSSYDAYETGEFAAHDVAGAQDTAVSYDVPGSHDEPAAAHGGQDDPYGPEPVGPDVYDMPTAYTEDLAQAAAHDAGSAHTDDHDEALRAESAEQIPDVVGLSTGASSAAVRPVTRSATRGGGRGRRRTPAKRSALLTVAVPSACVMSVAGIAAASVGGVGGADETKDETTSMAAADAATTKTAVANNALDTQLAALNADAENFADRASRTQERLDLKERQAAEKKKREEEAARREALRPKFALPVSQHGLSATYGQAGVNWMSVHTGIDFPVTFGTPVMAATDGTVRTQWNSAYGNMAIVTAADGTETWYCHLSTTKIRSGSVKAGDVIAYSGSSGNSTGPHLHFEVRPGGGSAIDPMPWLRSHGLNPN